MMRQSNLVPARLTACMAMLAAGLMLASVPAAAQSRDCKNTGNFDKWLSAFKAEAKAQGISDATLKAAAPYMVFDPGIVARDRKQSVFSQTFLEFSDRMVEKYRVGHGANHLKTHAKTLAKIEQEIGVPGPVIVAFWGLESDFGATQGELSTIKSITTLAFDCRRPDLFRRQLHAVLNIIQRGDLRPEEMIGSWAGELGQTQFLAEHYWNFGVDFDGDGRVDLLKSKPDVLASTAKLLIHEGWRPGEPWLEEVEVPDDMPWQEADVTIQHPRSQWAAWGVKRRGGKALPNDAMPASLLLPMGRHGPAFLGYQNFRVFTNWNQSLVYATTAAYYATRLAGAPRVGKGKRAVEPFGYNEVKELQRWLVKHGQDVGEIDGKLGEKTRAGVRTMQRKLGLPADSYPTPELLAALRQIQ